MSLPERIAGQVVKMPPPMRALLDQLLAAGNRVIDLDISTEPGAERVVLMMDHPFRLTPDPLPGEIAYRQLDRVRESVFEFHTPDGRWSLLTIKFKPMVFEPLIAPPDPNPAYIERMNKLAEEETAREKTRRDPPLRIDEPHPELSQAANQFLGSMNITYEMWHDGAGYDLGALAQVPTQELPAIEKVLISKRPVDWRDIEALARMDSPAARAAVQAGLMDSDPKVRREAMNYAQTDSATRERHLLEALKSDDLFGALSSAIDEAAEFHPPAVIDALLSGAQFRQGETAVHFAALLYYIHGKAAEPFDWNLRPIFLAFNTNDRAQRDAVFVELCQTLGIQPG